MEQVYQYMDNSEKYLFFNAQDFVNDEGFWLWVVEKDPEQTQFWNNFIIENPGKRGDIEEARILILKLNEIEQGFPEDRKSVLWDRIETTRRTLIVPEQPVRSGFFSPYLVKAAAVFALLFLTAILYWFVIKPREIVLATSYGQTREFSLPDGSVILLNANSKLTYKDNWKDSNDREVWLSGEGFFEIKPKKNKQKFIVHADNLFVEVLGTSFNVYNRRKDIQVILKEGKIALGEEHAQKSMLLKPGDLVSYQQDEPNFIKKQVDPEDYLGWKKNQLSFREESLGHIFQLLTDNYNLQITAEDPAILTRKFTGTVPAGDLSILFSGLKEGHNLDIIQNGNKVLVKNKVDQAK